MSQQTLSFSESGNFKFGLQKQPHKSKYNTQRMNFSQEYPSLKQIDQEPKLEFTLDDFTDIKRIGSGKFGKVFSAVEKKSGVKVALKVVYKDLLEKYNFYSQMRKELEIHYRLSSHPNIIKMYAYFYDKETICSVLEFAKEGNLYQKLKKQGELAFNQDIARKIIQQLVSALWFLQERNVIHRDIKPENILVVNSDTWHIKLCDFGWSTHSINQIRTTFCGTPDYLAPEMIQKTPYDDKIDNWAVGILTYELLTGASPFAGPSQKDGANCGQHDIYRNIQNVDLCYNKNYETRVGAEAKDFISQILNVDPKARLSLKQIAEHPWLNQN